MSPRSLRLLTILCIIAFAGVGSADCDVTGEWSKASYIGGETMRFVGETDPSSGFIRGYIENPLGDRVYEIPLTQVGEDFEFNVKTSDAYLNGTYKARVFYDKYPNGTTCSPTTSVTASANLKTNNTRGDLYLNITIDQKYSTQAISVTGSPVDTPLGTLTSLITGTGIPGLVPSIKIGGTQLAPGAGIGSINLELTQCQKNEDILQSYNDISSFLNSDYTDVLSMTQQKALLERNVEELSSEKYVLQRENNNLTGQVSQWKTTAESKWDSWLVFVVGMPLGFLMLILFRLYAEKAQMLANKEPPSQFDLDTGDILAPKL
jgi:hypothetical protein